MVKWHQDQMEETQKIHTWMTRMTGEFNRLRRIQPGWLQQWPAKTNLQPPQPSATPAQAPAPSQAPAQAASSGATPGIPLKAAPVSKNPSMSSAPRNAPFPSAQSNHVRVGVGFCRKLLTLHEQQVHMMRAHQGLPTLALHLQIFLSSGCLAHSSGSRQG